MPTYVICVIIYQPSANKLYIIFLENTNLNVDGSGNILGFAERLRSMAVAVTNGVISFFL